ncbi:hypothetical protein BC835DRAFT_1423590 [Cytidiella melzeri]|nr:hypothetical protein BC835DRAFT_1423590 [Cytidiella melzeri]
MRYSTTIVLALLASVGPAVCAPLESHTVSSDDPSHGSTTTAPQDDAISTLLRREHLAQSMELLAPRSGNWKPGDGMPGPGYGMPGPGYSMPGHSHGMPEPNVVGMPQPNVVGMPMPEPFHAGSSGPGGFMVNGQPTRVDQHASPSFPTAVTAQPKKKGFLARLFRKKAPAEGHPPKIRPPENAWAGVPPPRPGR